jgi:hypothetical protein
MVFGANIPVNWAQWSGKSIVALIMQVIRGLLLQQNNAFLLCLGLAVGGVVWEVQACRGSQ